MSLPNRYQWHDYLWDSALIIGSAIEADSIGNVYVGLTQYLLSGIPGVDINAGRILQKYEPDGTKVLGEDGGPWWIGFSTVYSIPWQKILVDEINNRIYVIFAVKQNNYNDERRYWLSAHYLNSGEKVHSWGNYGSKFIGNTFNEKCGLCIDSDGNIWTVINERIPFMEGTGIGFRIRKWSLNTGDLLDEEQFGQPNVVKNFVAFGINQYDHLYIAYNESNELIVTKWDNHIALLHRINHLMSFAAPDDPSDIHHPIFHDGYLDDESHFVIGGYWYYDREEAYEAP